MFALGPCRLLVKLRVFQIKVLRKTFGAKRDKITGEWRKLHSAEPKARDSARVGIKTHTHALLKLFTL